MYSFIAPMLLVVILFMVAAGSLASHPAGTVQAKLSYLFQGYACLVCTTECYKFQATDKRGKLRLFGNIPAWPLMTLPFPISMIGLLLAATRAPSHNYLGSESFFNRQVAPQNRWEFLRDKLPRFNTSDLRNTKRGNEIQSFLRCRLATMTLQVMAIGILAPLSFPNAWAEYGASLGAVILIMLGSIMTLLKSKKSEIQPSRRSSILAWSIAVVGSSAFGLILGSAVGRRQMEMAGIHLANFGLLGMTFLGLFLILFSVKISLNSRTLIWVPVMPICGGFGMLAYSVAQFRSPLEQALITLGCMALFVELPCGLLYQHLFLEPFTIRDVWRRDLPAATRKQLLPIAFALVMPLGGLANAVLAVASLRRDRMLRLWWEARGAAEHRVRVRV